MLRTSSLPKWHDRLFPFWLQLSSAIAALTLLFAAQVAAEQVHPEIEGSVSARPTDFEVEYGSEVLQRAWDHVPNNRRLCSQTDKRPLRFWRESFLSRDWAHRCAASVQRLKEYESSVDINLANQDPVKKAQVVFDYANACLRRLANFIDKDAKYRPDASPEERIKTKILISMTSFPEVERLKNSVGELRHQADEKACNASLVDGNDGHVYLITAAHCLGKVAFSIGNAQLGDDARRFLKLYPRLEFESFSGLKIRLRASDHIDDLTSVVFDRARQDVVMVEIAKKSVLPVGVGLSFLDDQLEPWEPIKIVGVNPYLQEQLEGQVSEGLLAAASITMDPRCAVLSNMRGELLHNCQTEGQLSGSPMLVVREGKIWIAGLHTGGNLFESRTCGHGSLRAQNRGIALQAVVD